MTLRGAGPMSPSAAVGPPGGSPTRVPNILSIAGCDPSGGAGVLADVKTISAWGCYGMAAITAATAQNSLGVSAVRPLPADFVREQIDALFRDIRIDAVKIGMLGAQETVAAVAELLSRYRPPIVILDPVLASSAGEPLTDRRAAEALCAELLILSTLVTPNRDEACVLTGMTGPLSSREEIRGAAERFIEMGAASVLMKGGHDSGPLAVDVLFHEGRELAFDAPRLTTRNTHGTGCALSSAIACAMALGRPLETAVADSKAWLTSALAASERLSVGRGHGPLHHFWRCDGRDA